MIEVDWHTEDPPIPEDKTILAMPYLVLNGRTGDVSLDYWINEYKDVFGNVVKKWHWYHTFQSDVAAWAYLTEEICRELGIINNEGEKADG